MDALSALAVLLRDTAVDAGTVEEADSKGPAVDALPTGDDLLSQEPGLFELGLDALGDRHDVDLLGGGDYHLAVRMHEGKDAGVGEHFLALPDGSGATVALLLVPATPPRPLAWVGPPTGIGGLLVYERELRKIQSTRVHQDRR